MRIQVLSIKEIQVDATTVAFDSPLGGASASWLGTVPVEGASYDVELEIPVVLTWGAEIAETTASESILAGEGCVCLVGVLQSLSDDGVAAVQVGGDIVLVETVGDLFIAPLRVIIRVPEIRLFDMGL